MASDYSSPHGAIVT